MLASFTRFVGRLPVGRKLLLIYLLDLSAVIYISGILISEKYIAINFARKELAGNAYIAEIRDGLLAMPVPIGAAPSERPSVERAAVDRWVGAASRAEVEHGGGMASAEASRALVDALEQVAAAPRVEFDPFGTALGAYRALISRIGDQSNMILDPDLDSYYTMSLVLLRFPELDELLARVAQKAVETGRAEGPARQRSMTELLILQGRLDAAIKGTASDHAAAVAAGAPSLGARLAPTQRALVRSVEAFQRQTAGVESIAAADLLPMVSAGHAEAVERLGRAWRSAGEGLDALVQARIDHLLGRMWLHLGTAAALLIVILSLVYFVARRISQPIRQLASVADQVSRSGDYSVRAVHAGADEIGQLVGAFNGMLSDLDRARAVREDMAAARRAEEAQRALLSAFPTPLIVTSVPDHRVLHANGPAQPWLAGVVRDPWATCLESSARARYFQRLADLGSVDGFEVRWRAGGGVDAKPEWALLSGRQLIFQGQSAVLTVFTPISELKLLEQRLQLWAKVFEASSEGILILDAERRVVNVNRAFQHATGWELVDIVGRSLEFLHSDQHDATFFDTLWHAAVIRGLWQGEVWLKRRNGQVYPTWMVANAVRGPDGRLSHLVAAAVDITDHKSNEARIHHLAHHDVLTDLPNRALCIERLRMAVEQAGRSGLPVGVVFIDLDRFKTINDSMGHHVGDGLLRSVAQRLLQAVRVGDTVSRLGGDEFVVVLNGARSQAEIAEIVDERVLPLIRKPHSVEGFELHVGCSAGIAVFPQDGRDIDHLMRHADAAMYQAKSKGRDQAVFFAPELHARAQERHAVEIALRHVVERDELRLHYQPRIDARTQAVVGVEALLRWLHPEQGELAPDRFIPVAEETGQIVPIGAWVLDEAARQHDEWRRSGLGEIAVSVNVSALQLRDPDLAATVEAALRRHGVEPGMIELELTETALMESAAATVSSLEALKSLGVMIAIDDFGTGYSSLNYLHQFQIDKLKIDQSFVRAMLDDAADLAITQAIVGLGHTLGLRVVAEGVERVEEELALRDCGCDELQGYLYARPMAAAALAAWIAERRALAPTPTTKRSVPVSTGTDRSIRTAAERGPARRRRRRAGVRLRSEPAALAASEDERGDGQHDEHEEQNLRDARGARGDAAETEECGDQGDDQEDDGVVKHGVLR